jgi:hypothetical protein
MGNLVVVGVAMAVVIALRAAIRKVDVPVGSR